MYLISRVVLRGKEWGEIDIKNLLKIVRKILRSSFKTQNENQPFLMLTYKNIVSIFRHPKEIDKQTNETQGVLCHVVLFI